jgi:hypothetical protein
MPSFDDVVARIDQEESRRALMNPPCQRIKRTKPSRYNTQTLTTGTRPKGREPRAPSGVTTATRQATTTTGVGSFTLTSDRSERREIGAAQEERTMALAR